MAKEIFKLVEELIGLLSNAKFWTAVLIIIAIIVLTGMGASLAAAPYSPEVSIEVLNFAFGVVGLVVLLVIVVVVCKYIGNKI